MEDFEQFLTWLPIFPSENLILLKISHAVGNTAEFKQN